jgi:hypothetical protein
MQGWWLYAWLISVRMISLIVLLPQAHPDTHLFMQYENMIDDPHSAVRSIAEFLEIPVTEEMIAKVKPLPVLLLLDYFLNAVQVVKASSISEMRGSSSDIGLNHLRQGKH